MPLALEPGGKYPVVLASDKDKPVGEQPTFYFRALTLRDSRAFGRLSDASEFKTTDDLLDSLIEALESAIVDWENMGCDYEKGKLEGIINRDEARELIQAALVAGAPEAKN